MSRPFFSVIIPAYNRAPYLKIAIESVLAQDYKDYELIVVDDGSTDDTKKVVKDFTSHYHCLAGPRLRPPRQSLSETGREASRQALSVCLRRDLARLWARRAIRYFHQANKGPAAARNRGIQAAKGKWLCFLDSDDRFVHFKLSRTAGYIHRFPKFRILHTEELWYRDGDYLEQKNRHRKPDGFCFEQALKSCCVSISTAVIHKSVFSAIGKFDETFRSCEDYEFWLRALRKFPLKLIPEYLTIKDGGRADQQSQKFFGMDRFRVRALLKIIPLLDGGLREKAVAELVTKSSIYYQGASKRAKPGEAALYRDIISRYA
jgi:glycosyltransferase involved in cell wall biosynthesis